MSCGQHAEHGEEEAAASRATEVLHIGIQLEVVDCWVGREKVGRGCGGAEEGLNLHGLT